MGIVDTMKILADETRFRIVELLLQNDYCVGALANRLGISGAAVSQHLQILRKGGLVKGEKRGYWTHYVVERSVLNQMAEALRQFAELPSTCESGCSRESSGQSNAQEENTVCKCGCEHSEKLKKQPGKVQQGTGRRLPKKEA
jgi:DNA-binding transcriptional ArsR family regulator